MSDILDQLRDWKPKGELCYEAKSLGLSWAEIDAVCGGSRVQAFRWASRNGKEWPVVVKGEPVRASKVSEKPVKILRNEKPLQASGSSEKLARKISAQDSHVKLAPKKVETSEIPYEAPKSMVERGVELVLEHEEFNNVEIEDGAWVKSYLAVSGVRLTVSEIEEVLELLPAARRRRRGVDNVGKLVF